ncbi:MAG TPA: ATP-dependent zinc metalloprotease FtsH [Candidatus Limnocylindria bacterium]|nr:ATP-dependent zinc metalloprotease FtsH [Candidatus Limnocylindria bacterium]
MKVFRRRQPPPSGGLPGWRIGLAVGAGAVAATALAFVIATATGSTRSVWNQPQTPIGDVLNRVDAGQVKSAVITGERVVLTDRNGATFWTQKESGTAIADELRQHGVQVSVAPGDSSDLVRTLPNLVGLLLLVTLVFLLLRRSNLLGSPMGAFTKHLREAGRESSAVVTFAEVAGVDEAKQELEEVVRFLRTPAGFRELGARMPRGVLLVGPPGTGKTLLSRAVAGEAGVPYFSLSGSDFVEMFVGVGAARVRDLFRHAKKHAPCIIFIDEIDALGRKRGASFGRTNEEREQTLNQLLVEMDGFHTDEAVVVVAATNRPDVLDPALLRSGRFDRRVAIESPDINGRRAILALYARAKPLSPEIDLEVIARQTPGFTGADLSNLLNEAAILAARGGKRVIGRSEMEEAAFRVMAGPEKRSRILTPEEKAIIAYHEVGHALCMKSIARSDPVHRVSIVARGQALGVTVQLPKRDRYLTSKSELQARMVAAMGGRAAEEIIFGDATTGAKQDIEVATSIARHMVCEFGMSERLGLVSLRARDDDDSPLISELTAEDVDAEVKALIDAAYRQAVQILQEKRAILVRIAEHLQQVETIDGAELDALLASDAGAMPAPAERRMPVEESGRGAQVAAAEADQA